MVPIPIQTKRNGLFVFYKYLGFASVLHQQFIKPAVSSSLMLSRNYSNRNQSPSSKAKTPLTPHRLYSPAP